MREGRVLQVGLRLQEEFAETNGRINHQVDGKRMVNGQLMRLDLGGVLNWLQGRPRKLSGE